MTFKASFQQSGSIRFDARNECRDACRLEKRHNAAAPLLSANVGVDDYNRWPIEGLSRISQRMRHFITCVMLLFMEGSALPAETRLPFDSRSLVEVHRLDVIPKEVIALLGSHRGGPDGVTDRFDRFKAASAAGGNLPSRYLETAGVSSAAVVVIYQEAGRPPSYHAVAVMMTSSGWSQLQEWTLDENPLGLRYFPYSVDSARYPRAHFFSATNADIVLNPVLARGPQLEETAHYARTI